MKRVLEFQKENHKYILKTLNRNKVVECLEIPSVTQICSPRLSVTASVKAAAIHGTAVHGAICDLGKTGKCNYQFEEVAKNVLTKIYEKYPKNQYDFEFENVGYWQNPDDEKQAFAGTADLIVKKGKKVVAIIDFKTSKPQEWHAMQVSGYAMIFGSENSELYDLYVSSSCVKLIRVQKKDFFSKYLNWLTPADLTVLPDDETKINLISQKFENILKLKKELEEVEADFDIFKKNLLTQMQSKNIKKFKYRNIYFTATEPTYSFRLDTKKFKEDNPEVYQKYAFPTEISAALRIKEVTELGSASELPGGLGGKELH